MPDLAEALKAARAAGVAAHQSGVWLDANPYYRDNTHTAAEVVRAGACERAWRRGWLSVGTVLDNLTPTHRVALGVAPDRDITLEQYHQLQMLERGDATRVSR